MFKWIKKKMLKSIIKDATKELLIYKRKVIAMVEEHKDELLQFIKEKLTQAIKDFVASKINR